MKREYDFSRATRGKFYHKGAELRLPIYLDTKMRADWSGSPRGKAKSLANW